MVDVVIDAGHGGRDTGAIGISGLQEKECTLYIARKCGEILLQQGLSIKQTRENDSYIGLSERAKIANESDAKYFVSIHINSAEVSTARGTEIYALSRGKEDEKLADEVLNSMVEAIKLPNRGVKFANFAVLRETSMPAILIEVGFISNPIEEELIRKDEFKDKVALSICHGILKYMGREYNSNKIKKDLSGKSILTSILSQPLAVKEQAKQWAKDNGGTETFIALADLYWKYYLDCGLVNPVVAFAQAAFETNYGSVGVNMDESYKNPCGLRNSDSKEDTPASYCKFKSWKDGVCAHLDHLALYAGANGYPREDSGDPRHFSYLFGRVKNVEELSGNWVPADDYGLKIIQLMFGIENTVVRDTFEEWILDTEEKENITAEDKEDKFAVVLKMKDRMNNLNSELEKIKEQYNEIYGSIDELEKELIENKALNEKLVCENKELQARVEKYQGIIEDILNIINQQLSNI